MHMLNHESSILLVYVRLFFNQCKTTESLLSFRRRCLTSVDCDYKKYNDFIKYLIYIHVLHLSHGTLLRALRTCYKYNICMVLQNG